MLYAKDKSAFRIKILIALVIILIGIICGGGFTSVACAEEIERYSDVLDDLHKDKNFDESFYPAFADDYSLQVIQLAESSDKELFVYVYQPSGEDGALTASSINISLSSRDNLRFYNYKLTLLDHDGVFYKYRVNGLTVSSDVTRYYTISSIYRPFDSNIDDEADHGNTITYVNYDVSKEFCFKTVNGESVAQVLDVETIVITDKFVGFCRYSDGFKLYVGACDSHFVAFNTDRDIDRLMEADVYYTSQSYSYSFVPFAGENKEFGEKQDNYAYLTYTQRVMHTGDGLFAATYTWDRIETVEQFLAENDVTQNVYSGALIDVNVANKITEAGVNALKGKKWVLRFAETPYSLNSGAAGATTSFSTIVGDVTILRLKFETDGVIYDLGTIDNMQSGDPDTPVNDEQTEVELSDMGKLILLIIGLILLLVIFGPILPYILKAVIWVIMLPFRLIAAIIKAIKKSPEDSKNRK